MTAMHVVIGLLAFCVVLLVLVLSRLGVIGNEIKRVSRQLDIFWQEYVAQKDDPQDLGPM